jgi:hypothetical protein
VRHFDITYHTTKLFDCDFVESRNTIYHCKTESYASKGIRMTIL